MKVQALLMSFLWLVGQSAFGVTGRNPTGVNVNSTGPTSVFITFQGTDQQASTDAFWCGELVAPIPANGVFVGANPCVPGTIFGHLPRRLDQSRSSGVSTTNVTDIMTIPASVSRRAFQAAADGAVSSFFYVRKFTGNGADEYVVVTCRMAGGGARVPFALMKVVPYFSTETGKTPVQLLETGDTPPPVAATLYYNGSGRLKGRWEIVKPGDPEPTDFDLLPEGSLPIEKRGLQQRYTVLDAFNVFLPPTGKVTLKGPPPGKIPTDKHGPYKILLRIEATNDKEGNSNTGEGTVTSGGLAGFPLPVLRYFVATVEEIRQAYRQKNGEVAIELLTPTAQARLASGSPVEFSWTNLPQAFLYRLEVRDAQGEEILTALSPADKVAYQAPPWVLDNAGEGARWRVVAQAEDGSDLGWSEWRPLRSQ